MKVRIRCRTCGATREGRTFGTVRNAARADGWVHSNRQDQCAACLRLTKTGAAADRDGDGKTPAAAAPNTEEN